MNFTKTKLAVALASTLAVGTVQAAFDLEPSPNGHPVFASEAAINGTAGTPVGTGATALDVTTEVGFSIGEGTSKYVRYDLTNATFSTQVTEANFGYNNATDDPALVTFAIAQAGGPNDTFVIIEVVNGTGALDDVQQDDEIEALFTNFIKTTSMSTATMTVRTYGTAENAVAGTTPLASADGTIFEFGAGYAASCTPDPFTKNIDPVDPTQFEDASSWSYVSDFHVDVVSGVYNLDGSSVAIGDYFDANATLTWTGDFSAVDAFVHGPYSYMVTAGDNASASLDSLSLPADYTSTGDPIEFYAIGTMAPGDYTGTLSQGTGPVTYDLDGPLDLGTCATLAFGGSTDRLDFGLTPDGAFRQWVRITNPSTAGGDVTVTVYNDAGESASFNLGDIAGVSSSTLGAHASSGLINIDDVYAAATVADAGFDHNGGKLRVEVRGEFGGDAADGNWTSGFGKGKTMTQRLASGIYIQAVTLATDNTMFDQTK